jgi:hypothetical protein
MASALQLRAHLGTDHKANLKWIADQIMLFSEGGDVTKAILLNDGDGAREWMEATQMVRRQTTFSPHPHAANKSYMTVPGQCG